MDKTPVGYIMFYDQIIVAINENTPGNLMCSTSDYVSGVDSNCMEKYTQVDYKDQRIDKIRTNRL